VAGASSSPDSFQWSLHFLPSFAFGTKIKPTTPSVSPIPLPFLLTWFHGRHTSILPRRSRMTCMPVSGSEKTRIVGRPGWPRGYEDFLSLSVLHTLLSYFYSALGISAHQFILAPLTSTEVGAMLSLRRPLPRSPDNQSKCGREASVLLGLVELLFNPSSQPDKYWLRCDGRAKVQIGMR